MSKPTVKVSTPTVKKISPSQGPTRGSTLVKITGSGFTGATAVLFGKVGAKPTHVSDEVVQVPSPVGTAGAVDIRVDVPSGLSPIVTAGRFTYVAPSISVVSPDSGSTSGGTRVTITGSGFTGATAVLFGKVNAKPTSVSDEVVKVLSPVGIAGKVGVSVDVPTGLIVAADKFTYRDATVNALFVVINQTGIPDDLVFVKFLGAEINKSPVTQTYGDAQPLSTGESTSKVSYSLTSMTATVPDALAFKTKMPIFQINDYNDGRIYFSLGLALKSETIPAAQAPTDADFRTVYGFVEPSIFQKPSYGQTNIDASYVDFVGLPVSIAIKNRSDGTLATPPLNNPLATPHPTELFKTLTMDVNVPEGAVVAASSSATDGAGNTVNISGTARILSPSAYDSSIIAGALPYHGWKDGLISVLRGTPKIVLTVASYKTIDSGVKIAKGTLFGFGGSAESPIGRDWSKEQDYSLTARALADLNPKGDNKRITSLKGVSGIKLSGTGGVVGKFDIYLTDTDLEERTGVYGANPAYTVDWLDAPERAVAYPLTEISNDLAGRVVGDLLAGFNFGWAACATTVAKRAEGTDTAVNLTGTVFDVKLGVLAKRPLGTLSTGQFFYLLSLQPNTAAVAKWFGQSIQPSAPTFYNNYASDLQSLTNCYNMAFTDRLQGGSDPDMFFTPSASTYVEITLLPGAYKVIS